MNRRERRRAAALPMQLGVHVATIEHDQVCGIYRGAGCTCVPDISISGPSGVTVIDEHGVARRVISRPSSALRRP